MTAPAWLAQPLRRFISTAVLVGAAHAGSWRTLQAHPELPPATVDRVEVAAIDGSHTVTDPAAVARIVAIVRAHRGEWTRFPDTVCLLGSPSASFYRGAVPHGSIVLGTKAVILYSREGAATRMLSAWDAAELRRWMER